MRYKKFTIKNYRAITKDVIIDVEKRIIPLVGVNECGKTTILKAIYCFDKHNDNEYEGKHLKNTKNLYDPNQENLPIITADIDTTANELEQIIGEDIQLFQSTDVDEKPSLRKYETVLDKTPNDSIVLKMTRNLNDKQYFFNNFFDKLPGEIQNKLGEKLIGKLPYILYNDDFNDRPLDNIKISSEETKAGWESIFERVFNSTNEKYSLQSCLKESDSRVQRSILSDVEKHLNKTLTDEWIKFSPKREEISLGLTIDTNNSTLNVHIKDTLNGDTRFFNISDRSKGFNWYYNFIMKIKFNPKYNLNIRDTVFLLDEPGSYLHEAAQTNLCEKLKDISKNEGIVIYCTHSPKLLQPQYIPINNILIVDKSKKGYVSAKSINDYKTSSKRNSAMQPIFEALMIPEYETISSESEKIICVEGIHDKYAIELFAELPQNYLVFPSVNAESIINNVQYFIAYKKNYIALWDNDDEGKKCYGKAKNLFGSVEAENFLLLPSKNSGKRRMEEMFSEGDLEILREELKLQKSASYGSIITKLYLQGNQNKEEIIKKVSTETKDNFSLLSSMINKKLGTK